MTIELMEPRGGRVSVPQVSPEESKSDIVRDRIQGPVVAAPRTDTYYIVVEFPTPLIRYQEPDTDDNVSIADLRAISQRHAVREDSIDPEPGLPEGWK